MRPESAALVFMCQAGKIICRVFNISQAVVTPICLP